MIEEKSLDVLPQSETKLKSRGKEWLEKVRGQCECMRKGRGSITAEAVLGICKRINQVMIG